MNQIYRIPFQAIVLCFVLALAGCGGSSASTSTPPPPTPTPQSVTVNAGSQQTTTALGVFPVVLQALVTDANKNPLSGVTVTFTAPSTGVTGTFNGQSTVAAVTSSSGVATATALTAGPSQGTFTVNATVTGIATPAAFSETITDSVAPPAVAVGLGAVGTISYGQSATATVTLTPGSLNGVQVTGTVTLYDGGAAVGTATVTNGTASVAYTPLSAGSHPLTASYSGDSNFPASTSATPTTLVVTPLAITGTIASVSLPYGSSLSGMNGSLSGVLSKDVNNVQLTFTPATTSQTPDVGTYALNGALTGSAASNYALTVSGNPTLTITPAATTALLSASSTQLELGAFVTLNATVASTVSGGPAPTGTVTFYNGSTSLGAAALSGGSASRTLSSLPSGAQSITAVYSPANSDYTASTSSPLTITVITATAMSLSLSDSTPSWNEMVTLTANAQPASTVFTGTISFYEDQGILLGQVSVNNQSSAQWSQKFLGGSHTVYAVLSGTQGITSPRANLNVTAALLVPATGLYLGSATNGNAIDSVESAYPTGIGRPYAINIQYYSAPWTKIASLLNSQGVLVPDTSLGDDISHGRIPLISWGCDDAVNNSEAIIAAGDDTYQDITTIRQTAQALAQIPGPVLLRWAWEFNGFWGSHQQCGGTTQSAGWTAQSEQNFIGAWQKIWTIFQSQGATNVVFVWNPYYYKVGASPKDTYDPHSFYPGNTFVDWIGVDTYQGVGNTTDTFQDDMQPFYNDFTLVNNGVPVYGKPIMVGENGAPNTSLNTNNLEVQYPYIMGILSDVQNNVYPQLKALCWFDLQNSALDNNNGAGTGGGLDAMNQLGASSFFFQSGLIASSKPPTSDNESSTYAMPLSLTNNGLVPLTNVVVTSISGVTVVGGTGTVVPPGTTISFPNSTGASTLTAGETATAQATFTWPPSATCVQMTFNYSATQSNDNGSTKAYAGSNTVKVSRLTTSQCQ